MKIPKFKIGDKVKVVIPEIFDRIGYPLTIDDFRDDVEKHERDIYEFLTKVDAPWYNSPVIYKMTSNIKKTLAYGVLVNKKFGGTERSIHTHKNNHLVGLVCKITHIKTVRTGEYSIHNHLGYLKNTKNHKILTLKPVIKDCYYGFLIEDKNVERFIE